MKIKSLLAVLAISALLCVPAQAQDETRHEVSVSYGVLPNSIWIDVLTDVIPAVFGVEYENYNYVGPIGVEYFYHTSPLVGVGAVGVFATNNEDGYHKNSDLLDSHRVKSYFTFMPAVKFNWLRKDNWGMYSKLALGGTYTRFTEQHYDDNGHKEGAKETTNDYIFNFQASLIGVEAGNDHVRGFAEFGVGEQGVALAGIRFKF